jgi:hypothetical protein
MAARWNRIHSDVTETAELSKRLPELKGAMERNEHGE